MAVQVRVKLFGAFRDAVGEREVLMEVHPNSALSDLLRRLDEKCEGRLSRLVNLGANEIREGITIMMDGEAVRDLGAKLKRKDEVTISLIPPIGGG